MSHIKPITETDTETILEVDSIDVQFSQGRETIHALDGVSTTITHGETLGVVGESGSGKSTLALAILQALDQNGELTDGTIRFKGRDLSELSEKELRSIRGNEIAHVPQNPGTSLNPSMQIGAQIKESITLHQDLSEAAANEALYDVLQKVNIPEPEFTAKKYPHELSGGQQQRALIAMALVCNPELLILDEPTTGLDVTTQAKILDLINSLQEDSDMGILIISHNLGAIRHIADTIDILYAGEIMESGTTSEVFESPSNPYTQGLLAATPGLDQQRELTPIPGRIPDLKSRPSGCIFADRCAFAEEECRTGDIEMRAVSEESDHETRCRRWETVVENPIQPADIGENTAGAFAGETILEIDSVKKFYETPGVFERFLGGSNPVKAVNGVNLDIHEGEAVGLVGESGCGKSTLGRTVLGLHELTDGSIRFRGKDIATMSTEESREFRSECQMVFQDPESSLNPQKTIEQILKRPLEKYFDLSTSEVRDRIVELLDQVNLDTGILNKHPEELSGGQQQRVSIAQAFAVQPSLVVLDEPVASLDVSVTASIIKLLMELREKYQTSYLLISHDLSVISALCDRTAVMYLGKIVESGRNSDIFTPPHHPYTRALLSSVPSVSGEQKDRILLEGDVPTARNPPSGCQFHSRCPQKIGEKCESTSPVLEERGEGDHCISCHLDGEELSVPDSEVRRET